MSLAIQVAVLLGLFYNPADWRHYPAMNAVRGISATSSRVFIAVPNGVYIFGRYGGEHLMTLTAADGITGSISFCAYNPGRNELLVVSEGGLYSFTESPYRVRPLAPPFRAVSSIGIGDGNAWFETDRGLFRRGRPGDDFAPAEDFPAGLDWHGRRDSLSARDFPALAPFFVTDDQLVTRELHLARPDPRSRRLYVAARDYGVMVYNLPGGLPERHLRFGPPPGHVRHIARLEPDGALWFMAGDHSLVIGPGDEWRYARTSVADVILPPGLGRFGAMRELVARSGIGFNAVISDGDRFVAATREGLFVVETDGGPARLLTVGREPLALARAGHDTLLVGTDSELLMLTGDSVVRLADPFDRSGFGIYSIAVADNGTRWFGAFGGILRQSPDGEWEHIIPPGFDLGRPVNALAVSDSALFLPSRDGITVWDLRTGSWQTIGRDAGVASTDVSALYADDRYLWIAGPGMVSRFDYRNALR